MERATNTHTTSKAGSLIWSVSHPHSETAVITTPPAKAARNCLRSAWMRSHASRQTRSSHKKKDASSNTPRLLNLFIKKLILVLHRTAIRPSARCRHWLARHCRRQRGVQIVVRCLHVGKVSRSLIVDRALIDQLPLRVNDE